MGIKLKGKLKPEKLPKKEDIDGLPDQPYWNMSHYLFLQTYRECLDIIEAGKVAGLDAKKVSRLMEDHKIREAMEDAKDDFMESLNLTPKKGARKFMEVYNKIEKRFDEGDSKVAGPLSNMASTFLKATGQLGDSDEKSATKISININLGNGKNNEKIVSEEKKVDINLKSLTHE